MSAPYSVVAPINNLSLGTVTIALLREMFRRGETPAVFPVMGSQPDLSAQVPDQAFAQRLEALIVSAHQRASRKAPCFMNWHTGGALASNCERGNHLLTWNELDALTPSEVNTLKQQVKVYVTSRFTAQMMGQYGIQATYLPIGFDAHNHKVLDQRPKVEGAISYLLTSKWEKRKSHAQVLHAWAKRYGNNPAYRLNCATFNPFLGPTPQDAWNAMMAKVGEALGGQQYWNIQFLPWAPDNATYNVTLQSSEIVISMSGGEGRDLPCYHATAMGAWPVAMRAHAYLDYLNDTNAVLVSPNGKQPAADGVHFSSNGPFNVGNIFTFDDDAFIAACEAAEQKVKTQGLNTAGLALQQLTYSEAVDILLADLKAAAPA